MATEIERKFLVNPILWEAFKKEKEPLIYTEYIIQGYLNKDPDRTVRIRHILSRGYSSACVTIKGRTEGISRKEFEYQIKPGEALDIFPLCLGIIQKIRYNYASEDGKIWSIDEFLGKNDGLIVAEIELSSENEYIKIPEFIQNEVSYDPKYYNSNLSSDDPFIFEPLSDYQISFYKLDFKPLGQNKIWTDFGH
jgi:adenylate cyclase